MRCSILTIVGVDGNNTGNSRNGYNRKTIISDYGESKIAVPRDRNGEFEPKILKKMSDPNNGKAANHIARRFTV